MQRIKMKHISCSVLFLLTLFCLISTDYASQSAWHFIPSDVNTLHSKPANVRIAYGDEPFQFADLRLPKTPGPYPVVIIIHGGCWTSAFADLQNTSALADALRNVGFATWNIEYRREDNMGGGWPGTFNDIGNSADFLRNISSKYSLDLNRVIVMGHSAGGHLALWLAGRHKLPSTSPLYKKDPLVLSGVISLGGVPDLKIFRKHGEEICNADVVGKLLGDNEERIETRYAEVSPIDLLPIGTRQILIYGDDDQAVPFTFGETYLQKAKRVGDSVKLMRVKYAAHHEYNVPNSVTWPVILSTIKSLFARP